MVTQNRLQTLKVWGQQPSATSKCMVSMRYVLAHKREAIIGQMKHRRKIIKYVKRIMLLYTIHVQLRSRLYKYSDTSANEWPC